MNLDRYLERIGHRGSLAPDAVTLAALQRAHLLAVPFENLDIVRGVPIALSVDAHFDKIVARRRGGFCYEQNSLFGRALALLGFRVHHLSASVWAVRDGVASFGLPDAHLFLRVDVDDGPTQRTYLADVGFGENFREPLRLVDGLVQEQGPLAYRVDRDAATGTWTMSSRDAAGAWTAGYRFDDVPRPIEHFDAMCRYQQTSPRSHFTQKILCSQATPMGRVTLSGRALIETTLDGGRHTTPLADDDEAARVLVERFGPQFAA